MTNSNLYVNWINAKKNLDHFKNLEKKLRLEIVEPILEGKTKGTHNVQDGPYKIKAVKKVDTTLDAEILSFLWEDLSELEQDCIQYKPSLKGKEYAACENHELLDNCIITKPAMPTLSIKLDEEWEAEHPFGE